MKHTTSENATRYIGIILIIISAVSFGAMPIFARVAYASGADPITVLFLRFGIAAVVMLGIMLASKTPFPRYRRRRIIAPGGGPLPQRGMCWAS